MRTPPAGRPVDIRHLLNGFIDSYLYHSGRVDTTLPFDELRRRSLINAAAQAADGDRFLAAHPRIPSDASSLMPPPHFMLNNCGGTWP